MAFAESLAQLIGSQSVILKTMLGLGASPEQLQTVEAACASAVLAGILAGSNDAKDLEPLAQVRGIVRPLTAAELKRVATVTGKTGTTWSEMEAVGDLSRDESSACQRFHELGVRYLAAIGARHGIKPQSWEYGSSGGMPVDVFSAAGQRLAAKDQATVKEWRSALMAIKATRLDIAPFWSAVVNERRPVEKKDSVKVVAAALAKHWAQGSRFRRGRRAA
jgi:hypothetical protein